MSRLTFLVDERLKTWIEKAAGIGGDTTSKLVRNTMTKAANWHMTKKHGTDQEFVPAPKKSRRSRKGGSLALLGRLNIALPESLHVDLKLMARDQKRSVSAIVRDAVFACVSEWEASRKSATRDGDS